MTHTSNPPYKVAFCGTPEICLPTIQALIDQPLVDLRYVISMPNRPAGRGMKEMKPAVVEFAKDHNIEVFQTANLNQENDFKQKLKDEKIDFLVVFAFAQFLKQDLLDLPQLGCLNIHTSLLPAYRGAAPIQYAIKDGLKETGVSIQKMVLKMDAGDILIQKKVAIDEHETTSTLSEKLKNLSPLVINELFQMYAEKKVVAIAQDEEKVSFAPTIKKHEAYLDLTQETASDTLHKINAYNPWPYVQVLLKGKRFKLIQAQESQEKRQIPPGKLEVNGKKIYIGCQDTCLELLVGQLEGKPRRSASELINGFNFKQEELKQIT